MGRKLPLVCPRPTLPLGVASLVLAERKILRELISYLEYSPYSHYYIKEHTSFILRF